jgi:hypothetical protein
MGMVPQIPGGSRRGPSAWVGSDGGESRGEKSSIFNPKLPTARAGSLGGVKAIVVGAFAEHSADVHELVDELAAAGAHKAAQKYLMPAAAIVPRGPRRHSSTQHLEHRHGWRALSALLHNRLAFVSHFIGAPGHMLGGVFAFSNGRTNAMQVYCATGLPSGGGGGGGGGGGVPPPGRVAPRLQTGRGPGGKVLINSQTTQLICTAQQVQV